MKKSTAALTAIAMIAFAMPASAQVVTTTGPVAATHINFYQFGSPYTFTGGPLQVGNEVGRDVVFTSTYGGSALGDGPYGLGGNGFWSGKSFAGLNTGEGAMTFTFNDGPLSFVGAFINHVNWEQDVFMEALSTTGDVLASYNLHVDTPDGFNDGQFYGFQSETANIGAFRLKNGYVIVDDLTFSNDAQPTTATPEPVTMSLLGTGLFGVAAARRRRRRESVTPQT